MIFNRTTDRTRRSVEAAFEEARLLGHDSLGDEDLLLGILSTGDGRGAEALGSLGVTLAGARARSEEMLVDALLSIGIHFEDVRREAGEAFDMSLSPGRKIPFSPRAKDALVEARREMRRLGDDHLGTEHLLVGILRNHGPAVRLLAGLGVSVEAVEDRLAESRERG